MNKTSFVFIAALLFVILFAGNSFSQSKWSFSLTGGYNLPLSDLKGTLPDTIGTAGIIDFTKQISYFTTKGFGINANAKYTIDTTGSARITGGFYYNTFSQSKDYSRASGRTRTYQNSLNMISFSAGAEYNLRPNEKIDPYIGLEIAANFFSGKVQATGDTTITINRKSESRFGINANAGINVNIKRNISVLIGAKYCMNNLFGKSYETVVTTVPAHKDTNPNTSGSITYELPLNDGDHGIFQSLNINHLQIYAGVSLSFGKANKREKPQNTK